MSMPALRTAAQVTAAGAVFLMSFAVRVPGAHASMREEALIPIVGVSVGSDMQPTGMVANLILSFEDRGDHAGLQLLFRRTPGRFSHLAQTSVEQAIYRSARAAGMSPDNWTVILTVPYPHFTVYGDSLSAMVALSVIALARGDQIPPDRVMTGTVTPDGHIAPVGSVPLKVEAANQAHMRRVLVPDEQDTNDPDWDTPFLVQISPVSTVGQAYEALTDHALRQSASGSFQAQVR